MSSGRCTWRDESGRQRAETFATEREALQRDAELRELRWLGRLDRADAGKESLREAAEVWWNDHVEPNLAKSTILSYAYVLDGHLMPLLGDVPIRDIDPARVIDLQRALRERQVGPAMTHRVMMVLSGVMRHAVVRGRIDRNPVTPVKVAQPRRQRAIRPLAPVTVEQLRRVFLDRDDLAERHADQRYGLRRLTARRGARARVGSRQPAHDPGRAGQQRGRP